MNLYNHLFGFSDYLVSIRRLDTHISMDLALPTSWGIPKSVQEVAQIVPFELNKEGHRGISLVCEFAESEFEKVVLVINKIIKLNKEKEIKNEMFEQAVKSLRATFDKKDLDTLKTLEFKFSDKPIIPEIKDGTGETFELVEE
jgi:hypothetical protein